MRTRLVALILLMTGTAWPLYGAAADDKADTPLILAVHPYLSTAEIITRFTPLAEYLSQRVNRPVNVRVGPSYKAHIDAIGRDTVDIAFMGPAAYVALTSRYGPKPLLARLEIDGVPTFRGSIVVRRDSPFTELSDLKGKRFAFGEPDSTMGTLVPRYMLLQARVPLTALGAHSNISGHKNVALAVLAGAADAGAVKDEVFRELEPQGLRLLASTPAISEHLFVTRTDLPPPLIAQLRTALLTLKDQPDGVRIQRSINSHTTALVGVSDDDYANLREIIRAVDASPP